MDLKRRTFLMSGAGALIAHAAPPADHGIVADQGAHVFDGIHMLMSASYPLACP